MSKETGGPAFPTIGYDSGAAANGIGLSITDDPGMTLRDYFAAKALQGMCADPSTAGTHGKDLCEECYKLADAMLAARVKP